MPNPDRKLYQLIISRIDGDKISFPQYRDKALELVRRGIGGFIIFGGLKEAMQSFIAEMQSAADIPLFIASDIERGTGQQIEGASYFPCHMAMAAATDRSSEQDVRLLEDAIRAIATEAIDIGINMPLVPVLDVNRNPDNPIICTRAFSDNPDTVSWFGKKYIEALEGAGLFACAKHFPGHGETDIDSHISLPFISKSVKELNDIDIPPFSDAVMSGVSCMMIGHLGIPAFDSEPASLSRKIITDLLRHKLGFEGLVLTDALNMHALNGIKNIPAKCMNAGVDIILHPSDADTAVNELKHAIDSGDVKEDKIDTAVRRIIRYKSKIKNISRRIADYRKNSQLSSLLSERAVTLVKGEDGALPLPEPGRVSVLYTVDKNAFDVSAIKGLVSDDSHFIIIRDAGTLKYIHDTVVFALFTGISAWRGSSGIRQEEISLIKGIIDKAQRSIVVSFGSPYVLRHFSAASLLIAAYDTTLQAQRAVIKCLKGESDFRGKLPVNC